jgi:uncharacterized protein (DUF1697 family)
MKRDMPTTYVALLRGINVGGKNVLRMADLRTLVEELGGTNVETYIQSGNVLFDHASRSPAKLEAALSAAVAKALGTTHVAVTLRTAAQLTAALDAHPFTRAPDDHLHVMFLHAPIAGGTLASIDPEAFGKERFAIVDRELYMYLPNGLGKSKLAAVLMRHQQLAGATARNWRTLRTLAAKATARA